MIYEKNCKSHITVSGDDLCRPRVTVEQQKNEERSPNDCRTSLQTSKRHLYTLSRKIQRKKRLSAFMLMLLFSVSLFFVADHKLFHGTTRKHICSAAKDFVLSVSENENGSELRDIPQRTIYSLSFSDTKDTLLHNGGEVQSDAEPQELSASSVSSSVSGLFVDGTKLYPITKLDLSCDSIGSLSNETSFDVDPESLLNTTPKSLRDIPSTSEPLVLILHTHGCESYSEYKTAYPENAATRSEDTNKNVVQAGKVIAETLSDFGISAIHCETLHDKDSFINAYSESARSVKKYLEEYPSIRFVIDVHRDAIIRDSGESISACTQIAGQEFAQIMFVVGTNEQGHNHPSWQDNLSLALNLQESISESYPSLCRNINLRSVPFNQQLSSGYLLLEIGTSANTADEAMRSAQAFGQELARLIISNTVQ